MGNTFMKIKKYHTENIKKKKNTDTFYTQIYYSSNTGTFTVFRISDHLNYENLLVKIEWITKKNCLNQVLQIYSPFLLPSFIRREEKRGKEKPLAVIHLVIL